MSAAVGLAPLRVVRDVAAFEAWWASGEFDTDLIAELVAGIDDWLDAESNVSALLSEILQDEVPGPPWLRAEGLRPEVELGWLSVAVEPAYGSDGMRDGADVVLWLHPKQVGQAAGSAAEFLPGLLVLAYVAKPHRMFVPTQGAGLSEAVGEVIDTALALVNAELAERDRFNAAVRAPAD